MRQAGKGGPSRREHGSKSTGLAKLRAWQSDRHKACHLYLHHSGSFNCPQVPTVLFFF